MSSELTIDIQLTELGFSSWDFQVLNQKETHQTSDLEFESSSSSSESSSSTTTTSSLCLMPVDNLVDEETDMGQISPAVCPSSLSTDDGSPVNASLVHVDSTETSMGESGETICEEERGHVREKRRKCPWYDESADEELKEDKKKKIHKDQSKKDQFQERGAQWKLMSHDISGEENEEEDEDDGEEDDDGEDDDLTDSDKCDDLSSGECVCTQRLQV